MATGILRFDANAGADLLPAARDAMISALDHTANPSSIHGAGRRARNLVEKARENVASVIAARKEQIIFTSGATEAAVLAMSPTILRKRESLPVGTLYVVATEHPCVLNGGRLADRMRIVPVLDSGVIDLAVFSRLLERHDEALGVPMLAVMMANNETGVIQPVEQAVSMVKDRGGFVFCDAVQAFGRIPIDMASVGADFFATSSHKIGGPQGAGALVLASEDVRPEPLLTGGGQEHGHRAGTENVAAIVGFGIAATAVMNHLEGAESIARLRRNLEVELRRISPDIHIAGEFAARLPNTVMFVVPALSAETAVIAFDLENIAVSSGSACSSGKVSSSHVLRAMGFSEEMAGSGIRVSLPADASDAGIDQFLKVWRSIESRLRPNKAA